MDKSFYSLSKIVIIADMATKDLELLILPPPVLPLSPLQLDDIKLDRCHHNYKKL